MGRVCIPTSESPLMFGCIWYIPGVTYHAGEQGAIKTSWKHFILSKIYEVSTCHQSKLW